MRVAEVRVWILSGLICGGVLLKVANAHEAVEQLTRRYPYDPACPWGRVSNGKGMLVRCLAETEANTLSGGSAPVANSLPIAPPATSLSSPTSASNPGVTTTAPAAAAPVNDPEVGAADSVSAGKIDVTIGPVTADTGQLGLGKLAAAKDRYLKCVSANGGLKGESTDVEVRFLVRSRGRAEGVSIVKRGSLDQAAARCIADVVDRRYVGVPDEPLVGATLTLKFARVK